MIAELLRMVLEEESKCVGHASKKSEDVVFWTPRVLPLVVGGRIQSHEPIKAASVIIVKFNDPLQHIDPRIFLAASSPLSAAAPPYPQVQAIKVHYSRQTSASNQPQNQNQQEIDMCAMNAIEWLSV